MGKVCTLFPQFYYHGEVENHQQLKDKLLSELTDDKLSQPKEWNCSCLLYTSDAADES